MSNNLKPAQVIEALIGPPSIVGPIVGLSDKAGYSWRRSSALREAGDVPSTRTMRMLLTHAAARDIPLRAEHLIWGAPEAEVEDILQQMAARKAGAE